MNTIIETGISLMLIFFIFSTIVSIINELIAVNLQYRNRMLWKALAQLFDGHIVKGRMGIITAKVGSAGTPNTNAFYQHGHILSLCKDHQRYPDYIPAANFALAVIDLITKNAPAGTQPLPQLQAFKNGLATFSSSNGSIYEALASMAETSATIKELQEKIEKWFNDYMDRVTGWYKSHTLVTLRVISIGVVLVFNLNAIRMAKTIYKDSDLRTGLVAMAENTVENPEVTGAFSSIAFEKKAIIIDSIFALELRDTANHPDTMAILRRKADTLDLLAGDYTKQQITVIRSYLHQLDSVGLPLGWQCKPKDSTIKTSKDTTGQRPSPDPSPNEKKESGWDKFVAILIILAGWLISVGALSMGAPFWFDMLAKVVNVRRSGLKPKNNTNNQ